MTTRPEHAAVLSGGGEMGALMRSIDWSKTAVGPVHTWPQSLRTALSILLETGFPMYIAWGREFTQFYNDGYRPILGSTKHPTAMGISTRDTFAEIWDIIGPMFDGVMDGRPTTVVDFLLPLDRHGFTEECYFIFSYSPIREESGRVGGVLVTVTETTQRVLGERRLRTTQALAADTRTARTVQEACDIAGRVLGANAEDLPFGRIYVIAADGRDAVVTATCGEVPAEFAVADVLPVDAEPLMRVLASGRLETLDAAHRVVAVPIVTQGVDRPIGVFVAGTSARLRLDEAYQGFLSLVASQIGTAIAGAQALESAQARADALAELDRAKTAFFSNVSHEFRTPLTLMLGPTEDALASPERALRGEDLETVHRNQTRLLKLVNALLDFSKFEDGRVNAAFEPVDLAALTADLASAFRSATERAGLRLIIDCPPLEAPVYVDREMWEKIVLNLLSNAFKFTFHGSITVVLASEDGHVELRVRDTGVGIESGELDHVFDRFHRIDRSAARTQEGSGIGLALVRELVALHGGTISASSVLGQGSVFSVRLPLGTAHLPAERIRLAARGADPSVPLAGRATPYLEEALRWLPDDQRPAEGAVPGTRDPAAPRVLVADDNADMRDYLARLLGERFDVETVPDGSAALASVKRRQPDVIISDVMMPGLNGFQLVSALRAGEGTQAVPIILLSARAGEEARIDGLNAGADDYLVKPFSARELIARVEAQVARARLRSLEEAHAMRLASVFQHAPVGVAILRGPDHVFEFANQQYLELVARPEVVGKPAREALPELAGQGVFELLDRVYATAEPVVAHSMRTKLQRTDDTVEEAFFDVAYQPLLDEQRRATGIAVVVVDVSELTLARREAESANRAKDEFLAMLGHELRNPLAPILTALQLMRLRNLIGGEREREIIERQVRHVVSLVDDLLDVSRITRGSVQLKRARVDLTDVVAKAIEMTSPAIEERRHVLNVRVPRGLEVQGDAARLAQVLANLLTNAAKYTDPGGRISVEGRVENAEAVIVVTDAGRGIAPDTLPRIFQLFSQERQEIDRSEGGLGLGLAIVRSLVQAHGGTVEAHSAGKGLGASFTVRLPLAGSEAGTEPASESQIAAAEIPSATGLRILIVDDNPDAAEMLSESLRSLGHTVQMAYNGFTALQFAADVHPDVVLLDLGLPVMDGFEVAERLKAIPGMERVSFVAITGYGQEGDRERTQQAGFDEHMVKPVDLDRLEDWLRACQERVRGPAPAAADLMVAEPRRDSRG
jgi:signal transduction histidine kinase